MPRRLGVLASICLLGGASAAFTQSADDFLRTFGTVAKTSIVKATRTEWDKLPSSEARCINDALRQQSASVEALVQRGVLPSNPRIASFRSNCRLKIEQQAPQPTAGLTPTYSVEGVALGSRIQFDSSVYREYKCSPSDQCDGFTWCQKTRRESARRGSFEVTYSILHSHDGAVVYVNRHQRPAFFDHNEAERDIQNYSRKIGESPRITKMPRRSETSNAVLATWGKVELETLDNDNVRMLAEGRSPKKGLLIDFIGNFTRSAQEGLPIYRILGGAGFVWVASFEQKGRGALRFAAVDASASQPGLVATQPQNASQNDDQEPSRIQSELASAIREARGDAEATVARLQTELSTALEAKVEAELAAQKARTYAEIARKELELAIDDANAAKEEVYTLKASDGTSASYVVNSIVLISTSTTALLLLIVWTVFRMLGAFPRPAGKADSGLGVAKEPRLPTASTSATEAQPSIDQYLVKQLARELGVHDLAPGQGKLRWTQIAIRVLLKVRNRLKRTRVARDSIPSKQLSETPIGNTAASPGFPFIAVIHSFMVHGPGGRSGDEVLGPPLCRIYERSAVGLLPPNAPAPPSLGVFVHRASKIFAWWGGKIINGKSIEGQRQEERPIEPAPVEVRHPPALPDRRFRRA